MWAISIDPEDALEKLREQAGITFPLLMDPGSRTIKAYGLLNEDHGEIPHPAAIIVDTDGIVRYVRVDVQYTIRPRSKELLAALAGADKSED